MSHIYRRLYVPYTIEMMTVLIFTLFLNISNQKPSGIILFITISILLFFGGLYILEHYSNMWVFLFAILLFVTLSVFNYYILTAIVVALYVPFRLDRLYMNQTMNWIHGSILVSVLFIVLLQFTTNFETYYTTFHILLIVQLLLFVMLKIIKNYDATSMTVIDVIKSLIGISAVIFVTTVLSLFGFRLAAYLVKLSYYLIVNTIVFILRPLFDTLEHVNLDPPKFMEEETEEQSEDNPIKNLQDSEGILSNVPIEFFFYGIAVIILVVLLIFLKRNKNNEVITENETNYYTETSVAHKDRQKRTNKNTPTDKARIIYFKFEEWLIKHNAGRYLDETLEEWMYRLNIDDKVTLSVMKKYQDLRYNDIDLTEEELKEFKRSIKKMKEHIKLL